MCATAGCPRNNERDNSPAGQRRALAGVLLEVERTEETQVRTRFLRTEPEVPWPSGAGGGGAKQENKGKGESSFQLLQS